MIHLRDAKLKITEWSVVLGNEFLKILTHYKSMWSVTKAHPSIFSEGKLFIYV